MKGHTGFGRMAAVVLVVVTLVIGVLWPQVAFARAPQIRGVQQVGASVNPGDVEIFFGNNVAAGQIFDQNAAHITLVSESGVQVPITVYRAYFGQGAPDGNNPDPQGLRRLLYVSFPALEPDTTYTLRVSAGVMALGGTTYDGTSVTFTTESASEDEGDGDGSGGGSGGGDSGGDGSGDGPDEGDGSDDGSGSEGEPAGQPTDGDGGDAGHPQADASSAASSQAVAPATTPAASETATSQDASANSAGATFIKVVGTAGGSGGGAVAEQVADIVQAPWFWLLCLVALVAGALVQRARRLTTSKTRNKLEELTRRNRS